MRELDRTFCKQANSVVRLLAVYRYYEGLMPRTLVVGYGNIDRADDGVAYSVVNALRERLGQKALSEDDSGLEELGAQLNTCPKSLTSIFVYFRSKLTHKIHPLTN